MTLCQQLSSDRAIGKTDVFSGSFLPFWIESGQISHLCTLPRLENLSARMSFNLFVSIKQLFTSQFQVFSTILQLEINFEVNLVNYPFSKVKKSSHIKVQCRN